MYASHLDFSFFELFLHMFWFIFFLFNCSFFLSIFKTSVHIFKVVNFLLAALPVPPHHHIHSLFTDLYFALQEAFSKLILYKQVCLFVF